MLKIKWTLFDQLAFENLDFKTDLYFSKVQWKEKWIREVQKWINCFSIILVRFSGANGTPQTGCIIEKFITHPFKTGLFNTKHCLLVWTFLLHHNVREATLCWGSNLKRHLAFISSHSSWIIIALADTWALCFHGPIMH